MAEYRRGLLLVVVLAGLARSLVLVPSPSMPVPVQGERSPRPGPHQAPLFPWIHSILGDQVRAGNVILGTASAGLWYLIALFVSRRSNLAWFVGILSALHPFWILNTREIDDGVLATFLLALAIFLGLRAARDGGVFVCLLFGLALALLALTRGALLVFAWIALFCFLGQWRGRAQGHVFGTLAVVGFFGGLIPWAMDNLFRHGDVYPIVDSTYHHLWLGSTTSPMNPPSTVAELRGEFWERIVSQPGDVLRRRLLACGDFLLGSEWADRPWMNANPWQTWLAATLLWMLVLGMCGWRWSLAWHRETWLPCLGFALIPLPYILGHGERWFGPRLPWDGIVLLFAGFALADLADRMLRRSTNTERSSSES